MSKTRRYTSETKTAILERDREGLTPGQIARELGLHTKSVRRFIGREKHQKRPETRPPQRRPVDNSIGRQALEQRAALRPSHARGEAPDREWFDSCEAAFSRVIATAHPELCEIDARANCSRPNPNRCRFEFDSLNRHQGGTDERRN